MRSDVSGVRSSCDASATSCRCDCCDSSSAAEHRVEARAQPAELVVLGPSRRAAQVARFRDLLRRGCQPTHRRERGARHEPGRATTATPMPPSATRTRIQRSRLRTSSDLASAASDLNRDGVGGSVRSACGTVSTRTCRPGSSSRDRTAAFVPAATCCTCLSTGSGDPSRAGGGATFPSALGVPGEHARACPRIAVEDAAEDAFVVLAVRSTIGSARSRRLRRPRCELGRTTST